MPESPIKIAIKQICSEKGLSEESVIETINSALAAAFRKDFADKNQNVVAEFNVDTGATVIYDEKLVVENLTEEEQTAIEDLRARREALKESLDAGDINGDEFNEKKDAMNEESELIRKFNSKAEIEEKDAKAIDKKYNIGDIVRTELAIPGEFGRMAAQTAKQVIIQRLREAERNVTYQQYKEKEGRILSGLISKYDTRNVIVELDSHTTAILPPFEQIKNERYRVGDKIKVYLLSVGLGAKGAEIVVSRAHPEIVKQLFELEIPEIADGTIEIKAIAREAGARTKIAVHTADSNIDPIGSCIGQRGARIQTIISELHGEKIDIIEYSDDAVKFIKQALLPAKINKVELNDSERTAVVLVPEDQLSLTIGRAGQNVRLASKLTGWKISVREQDSGKEVKVEEVAPEEVVVAEPVKE